MARANDDINKELREIHRLMTSRPTKRWLRRRLYWEMAKNVAGYAALVVAVSGLFAVFIAVAVINGVS